MYTFYVYEGPVPAYPEGDVGARVSRWGLEVGSVDQEKWLPQPPQKCKFSLLKTLKNSSKTVENYQKTTENPQNLIYFVKFPYKINRKLKKQG